MTQLAYTVVGYAIGFYFDSPQLGAAIGSYLGAVQAAPDVQGPRVSDLKVQVSAYGVAIPKVYGSDRIAGNIVWSSGLIESEDSESAKGGPTVTTFSYSVSCAVLICEGIKGSVRRIWADAKLVYDVRSVDDFATQAASNQFRQFFTFYTGTETQLPDPTIESYLGAGQVEAFRGSCYIVFTGLPLADYGNRVPNFTFELSDDEGAGFVEATYEPLRIYDWDLSTGVAQHSEGSTEFSSPVGAVLTGTDFPTFINAYAAAYSGLFPDGARLSTEVFTPAVYNTSLNTTLSLYPHGATDADGDAQFYYSRTAYAGAINYDQLYGPALIDTFAKALVIPVSLVDGSSTIRAFFPWAGPGAAGREAIGERFNYDAFGIAPSAPYGYGSTFAAGSVGGSTNSIIYINTVLATKSERLPTHKPKSCSIGDPCGSEGGAQLDTDPNYCINCAGDVSFNYEWTIITGTARQLCAIEYRAGALYQNAVGPLILPADDRYDDSVFWATEFAAALLAGTVQADVSHPVTVGSYALGTPPADITTVDATPAVLSDIVSDICLSAGLTADQIDVTALTDEVLGFTRTTRMAARSAIEPLRAAFWFDGVESGDQIKFVKRGSAPVASLTLDDIAASADDSLSEQPVDTERGQEAELPNSVVISYKALSADYQIGTQQARRQVGSSDQQAALEVAVVLTDQRAAEIADVALYDTWVQRNKRTIKTARQWAHLEPTDVVAVNDGAFDYLLRVGDKTEDSGVVTLVCADSDAAIYSPNSTAGLTSGGGSTVRFDGPTRYELLDIPLLRAADDGAGFYVAASGYRDGWRGGELFRSVDGSSYAAYQTLDHVATIGLAGDALGDFDGGNMVDETNTVDVTVNAGTLASITQAQLLNNGNAAVIGSEVLQFKRADLIGEREYRLSGLLRGRLGTEQYIGTHDDNERFVLLTAESLLRPAFETAFIDQELQYKGVSVGEAVIDITPRDFTNTAAGLKPLSPVHLDVAPKVGGGYSAQWVRRSRFSGGGFKIGTDAPLAEASESYRVRVLDGTDVVEEQTVSTPTADVGVAATSEALSAVSTLAQPAIFLNASGSDLFGVIVADPGDQYAARFDGTGAVVATSPLLGSATVQACHGGGNIYVLSFIASLTAYLDSTVRRLAYSSIGTIAASKASSVAGDFKGVAFDGTYIWISEESTALLHRCDASTLATLATYSIPGSQLRTLFFEDGFLWITQSGGEVIQWNVTTHAQVARIVTGKSVFGVVAGDGIVFVVTSDTGPFTSLTGVYDTAGSPSLAHLGTTSGHANVRSSVAARWGDYIAVANYPNGVQIFDATTGALLGTPDAQAYYVSGVKGDNIMLSAGSNPPITTTEYSSSAPISAADYTGMTLEVSQISELAGPGFPATTTIPAS